MAVTWSRFEMAPSRTQVRICGATLTFSEAEMWEKEKKLTIKVASNNWAKESGTVNLVHWCGSSRSWGTFLCVSTLFVSVCIVTQGVWSPSAQRFSRSLSTLAVFCCLLLPQECKSKANGEEKRNGEELIYVHTSYLCSLFRKSWFQLGVPVHVGLHLIWRWWNYRDV